ncbi:nucleosome-remodeling factor subunit NURF301 isoform X2 [Schistocerca gregaria]|uniref:nucleosome-remodeling factor subunit NURF301 isoform X2 n=2 Tax=Schistocerca gregaria TaxID=7010 RepID=UPI00211EC5DD|nr:nucleosome-remodeling factor subunit NURF301 isoform X2 [Schistocerca gregaria]
MSTRGTKRRGRPPKSVVMERPKKFQYHLLKKPKYLLNRESKGSETPNSQTSTPTASRASSPVGSESSRRSSRSRGRCKSRRGIGGYHRRGYNPDAVEEKDSEYHYGSDFGDESSGKSEFDDDILRSDSEMDESFGGDASSDSDFSLSSYSTVSGTPKKYLHRLPSPEPLWLQNREIPPLHLPKSSEDLLVPKELVMKTLCIYEVLRHFRALVRLSPFRFEDFCAALMCEDQSTLLAEIHIMLLKALLREEDSQQTHFGPLDHKDSVNVVLFFVDPMTWPEVLRSYVESDKDFDSNVLNILNNSEYPFTSVENRLKVLQFMTDQFLITNPVREDLLNEGNIHYDDHCRICHRLGDLLCCETCPAVYHLDCIDPPMEDIPEEDWQCGVCRAHKVSGVTDCIPDVEKTGNLCRQEHLGFDRHGRKYWFLARRIFVESEDGETWYYSTQSQLEELMESLDKTHMEAALAREINDFKDEIIRQMELTEKITNQMKGNKKSYLDTENAALAKIQKERLERKVREEEERREKERQDAEDQVRRMHEDFDDFHNTSSRISSDDFNDPAGKISPITVQTSETVTSSTTTTIETKYSPGEGAEHLSEVTTVTTTATTTMTSSTAQVKTSTNSVLSDAEDDDLDLDSDREGDECSTRIGKDGKKHTIVTRSKTGSLQPRTFNMDDLKRRSAAGLTKAELEKLQRDQKEIEKELASDGTRITRLKAQQIATGTYMFKLGMENTFKSYTNQYSTNIAALNKHQRNEERDKRRHLSHKFSLTPASEFKWIGSLYGTRALLVSTLRQTVLQLESSIQSSFMHPNWPLLRKPWITAVSACVNARDFARALIVLQACIKPVVFTSVWHEALGHVKLQRMTASEREERKRQEKKDKKDKEEEEERNRLTYNFVKYTLGLKHQVWKQKGEEYRIHGQWGWLWLSTTRKYRLQDCHKMGLRAGPQKIMVQVQDDKGIKILAVDPNTYKFLLKKSMEDQLQVTDGIKIKYEAGNNNSDPLKVKVEPNETKNSLKSELTDENTSKLPVKEEKDKEQKGVALKNLKVFPPITKFEEINITKALTSPGRLYYPKIARKSRLDEFLSRRTHLKILEERKLAQNQASKGSVKVGVNGDTSKSSDAEGDVDIENDASDAESESGVDHLLPSMVLGKLCVSNNSQTSFFSKDILNTISKKVSGIRQQYSKLARLGKSLKCYSLSCNENDNKQAATTGVSSCYSPICQQKARVRKELLLLLKKANSHTNNNSVSGALNNGSTLPAQKIKKSDDSTVYNEAASSEENMDAIKRDLESAVPVDASCEDEAKVATPVISHNSNIRSSREVKQEKCDEIPNVKTEMAEECKKEIVSDSNVYEETVELTEGPAMCSEVVVSPITSTPYAEVEISTTTPESCTEVEISTSSDAKVATDDNREHENDDTRHQKDKNSVSDERQVTITTSEVVTTTTTITTQHKIHIVDGHVQSMQKKEVLSKAMSNSSLKKVEVGTENTPASGKLLNSILTSKIKSASELSSITMKVDAAGDATGTVIKGETCTSSLETVKTEEDDSVQRVYSSSSTKGRVYLKKISISSADKRKKRTPVKYPLCSTFQTRSKRRNMLILPQHELRKLARHSGRLPVNGYHHLAKPNHQVWPYPCSRPLFKTCWLYRTVNLRSLAAASLQLRIMWACLRWDDMQVKPPSSDGKHQVTTDTEIMSLEILKHRHLGQFLDRTQYLRRKVIIPLELPKTVREVTSIRSGLRKRKRAESPQSTEPQVTEEWVDEDKLELWEIKQYGDRLEKTNAQVVTRSRSGSLAAKTDGVATGGNAKLEMVSGKSTPEEIKEKMEQQLRMQRAAHQQKRALETLKVPSGQVLKVVPTTQQVQADGSLKVVTKVAIPSSPNTQLTSGKSTLTSLLTSTNNTSGKALLGTRRIFMTKGADGTTRVMTGPTSILPKTAQQPQSLIKIQPSGQTPVPGTPSNQQRVQIVKGPDGKLQVRGLMPGQQLVQMPDGKLHVLNNPQIQAQPQQVAGSRVVTTTAKTSVAASPTITQVVKAANSQVKQIAVDSTRGTAIPLSPSKPPQTVMIRQQIGGTPVVQKVAAQPGTVVVSGNQVFTPGQIIVSGNQVVGTPTQVMTAGGQLLSTGQFVVAGSNLAQQLASGKAQLATINGQQVLIRTAPPGTSATALQQSNAVVVTGNAVALNTTVGTTVTSGEATQTVNAVQVPVATTSNLLLKPVAAAGQQNVQTVVQQVAVPQTAAVDDGASKKLPSPATPQNQVTGVQPVQQKAVAAAPGDGDVSSGDPASQIAHPPGTIVKCVTAQVIQTQQGPRIVLQGLQGAEFTPQQLAVVQQQVKQQLLKAQATTGKQGVLGPTKIYLAVQASPSATATQQQQLQQQQEHQEIVTKTSAVSPKKSPPKVVVQQVKQPELSQISGAGEEQYETTEEDSQISEETVNGIQQQQEDHQQEFVADAQQAGDLPAGGGTTGASIGANTQATSPNKFILTSDYIQQTIKTALKQENLNPDIEEKLLQLQRYQERQMKHDKPTDTPPVNVINSSVANRVNSKKRPLPSVGTVSAVEASDAKEEWESPKRKVPKLDKECKSPTEEREEKPVAVSRSRTGKWRESQEERRRQQVLTKLQVLLFRHKELLKKDMIKKRALLEKELQIEIQKDLSTELAARTKAERNKQDEVRTGSGKRKSAPVAVTTLSPPTASKSSRPKKQQRTGVGPPATNSTSPSSNSIAGGGSSGGSSGGRKKEKLYCLCRTPYDETKFYVGCDLCNNWFHGECVGITEEMSKTLTEFVCTECRHARDTQELYCLCKQPYDESQFYICCDRCQDWFHGRCVGILQSEADNIDEYICPNCQRNSNINFANMKNLNSKDFEGLRKLIKQLQAHKSAWPFMEPVDPNEAPDYYKVIKEPMDLQTIELRINEKSYKKLSEFIGDMTKIFDNCRYYNPRESPFFKCAESLEAYFVQKIKCLREKLVENK